MSGSPAARRPPASRMSRACANDPVRAAIAPRSSSIRAAGPRARPAHPPRPATRRRAFRLRRARPTRPPSRTAGLPLDVGAQPGRPRQRRGGDVVRAAPSRAPRRLGKQVRDVVVRSDGRLGQVPRAPVLLLRASASATALCTSAAVRRRASLYTAARTSGWPNSTVPLAIRTRPAFSAAPSASTSRARAVRTPRRSPAGRCPRPRRRSGLPPGRAQRPGPSGERGHQRGGHGHGGGGRRGRAGLAADNSMSASGLPAVAPVQPRHQVRRRGGRGVPGEEFTGRRQIDAGQRQPGSCPSGVSEVPATWPAARPGRPSTDGPRTPAPGPTGGRTGARRRAGSPPLVPRRTGRAGSTWPRRWRTGRRWTRAQGERGRQRLRLRCRDLLDAVQRGTQQLVQRAERDLALHLAPDGAQHAHARARGPPRRPATRSCPSPGSPVITRTPLCPIRAPATSRSIIRRSGSRPTSTRGV